jgi:hypothetical protein
MEDFNQPIPERIDMFKRLQEAIGNVTPHFWAACQICDLNMLGPRHLFWNSLELFGLQQRLLYGKLNFSQTV